jgi:hypothetical protein
VKVKEDAEKANHPLPALAALRSPKGFRRDLEEQIDLHGSGGRREPSDSDRCPKLCRGVPIGAA